jgi:beta-mannosidase
VTIDLTKQKWTLRGYRPNYWQQTLANEPQRHWQPDVPAVPAVVPGSAHTALRTAGWLPDWNVGLNSLACEWVEHRQWEFRTKLRPLKPTMRESVTLHCDGLDYAGWVAVDKNIVGEFRGALYRHRFDLTNFVSDGKPHALSIVFDPPPPEQGQIGWTSRSRYFKPRYNYSWDWCPRLVPVGIWDALWIELGPPRPRVVKVLTSLAEDLKTGRVNVFLDNPLDAATVRVALRRARR